MRAVFMGSDELFSLPVLDTLIHWNHGGPSPVETVGVVTQPDRPTGRGRGTGPNAVKRLATESGSVVLQPERLVDPDAVASVLDLDPDLIVVASYGQILPKGLLDAPRFQSLNLHPSLLPRYRGSSPVASAILGGESRTGTTLMVMAPRMDSGPIIGYEATDIGVDETAGELTARLADLSAQLLVRQLPGWIDGLIEPIPQNEDDATYTSRFRKEDGAVDWSMPADAIARRIRALNPWPGAFTFWDGRQLKLLRARAASGSAEPGRVVGTMDDALAVGAGDGLVLMTELQIAGSKAMNARAFLHGHPELKGSQLSGGGPWLSA